MHHLLESYRINPTWLIRTNSFIILSSFLISWRYLAWLCAGSFAPKYHSSSSSFENIWNASRWTSAYIQDAVVWNRNAWITLSTCTGSISIQWIAQLVSLMTLIFVMILHYPLESVINHAFDQKPGQHSIFYFHNLILQLSYTYLRCLWKLEQGYLKLKLSWFPKFLSKTVAKFHLFLLCLGKHCMDAQRSRSIFSLSYNEFSNKSAFFFSFGGANKNVFFFFFY